MPGHVIPGERLPEDLARGLAEAASRLGRLGSRILYFTSIGSTNDIALALAAEGTSEGAAVIADAQTAGRGRRGRSWFSPDASGLYVSVVLEPEPSSESASGDRGRALVTLAAGVAIAEGIQTASGLRVDIKWPNDLLAGPRKLAGILAEASGARVVVGYGINVGHTVYPSELADRATSLEAELGRPVDRVRLCVETLVALARRYDDLRSARFDASLDAWRERAPGCRGRRITWETPAGARTGVTAGIDDRGALLVTSGERIERIVSGEVVECSWR